MPQMKAEVIPIHELPSAEVERMFHLYNTYFEATSQAIFQQDLREKDYVILLRDGGHLIQGFSTGKVLEHRSGRAVYSGDTIIHSDWWGEQTLPLAFAVQAGRIKAQHPDVPLHWFLITKGYRTYRYLPLFFYEYYPRWNRTTPPEEQSVLDELAMQKFGDAYHRETGVIHFAESRGQLRGAWADIRDAFLRKPDVRFFLERNPCYRQGDELACLTELSEQNIRPIARRAFLEGFQGE